jgi:rare lipoprotein A (peptidoglycan hydrolase)
MRTEVALEGRLYGALLAVWSVVLLGCDMDRSGHRPRAEASSFEQKGEASWYGPGFHGRQTASGETFDQNDLTAAHPTLPLGTKAEVTDVETGKSVEVTINDRGPYIKDRVIDLSKAAAKELGMTEDGTTTVKIEADPPGAPQTGKDDARNGLR